ESPDTNICLLKTRPEGNCYRCFSASMKEVENLDQLSMDPTSQSIKQGHQRTSNNHNSIHLIAISTMVNSQELNYNNRRLSTTPSNKMGSLRSSEKQTDPVTCSLNNIVKFFEDQLNTSSYPTIIKAMRDVYNRNPPNSYDDNVVDLTPAFDKIHSFGNNETMNISLLL
ncbi:6984_t:CDS:2, partial [Dentiscutata erythropus]